MNSLTQWSKQLMLLLPWTRHGIQHNPCCRMHRLPGQISIGAAYLTSQSCCSSHLAVLTRNCSMRKECQPSSRLKQMPAVRVCPWASTCGTATVKLACSRLSASQSSTISGTKSLVQMPKSGTPNKAVGASKQAHHMALAHTNVRLPSIVPQTL